MTIIVNVLGNNCIHSDTFDYLTFENIMCACKQFTDEYCVMPEEIFIIASGKLIGIEIDLESVLHSELVKQLQEE